MIRGTIYGILAAAIWGGMYVVSDLVLAVIPPFLLLTSRLVLGLVVLGIVVAIRGGFKLPDRRETLILLGVGFIGFGIAVGTQFTGTDKSTAINGALITSASPAFILLFAVLILKERITPVRVIAVLLASAGVVLIVDPAQADFSSATFRGDVELGFAALTWGLYSVLVRKVSERHDTLDVTVFAFAGGLLLTIPAGLIEGQTRSVGTITPLVIAGVLYLGVISTAAAMWLWNRAFALVDASIAGLFFFAQPVTGAVLAVAFLGQPMTPTLWLGSGMIAGALVLSLLWGE